MYSIGKKLLHLCADHSHPFLPLTPSPPSPSRPCGCLPAYANGFPVSRWEVKMSLAAGEEEAEPNSTPFISIIITNNSNSSPPRK